jgi:hypothetical protein
VVGISSRKPELLKSLPAAILNPDEHMSAAKKIAIQRLGHDITKLKGLTAKQQRNLPDHAVAGK